MALPRTRAETRRVLRRWACGLALLAALAPPGARADAARGPDPVSWTAAFAEVKTIRILTVDADGALRDTPVWVVTSGDAAWVRTNDSRWLANIRRGSPIDLRTEEVSQPVGAVEVDDASEAARVEELFKAKYGWVQRVMSSLRISEPTVLRLRAVARSLPLGAERAPPPEVREPRHRPPEAAVDPGRPVVAPGSERAALARGEERGART